MSNQSIIQKNGYHKMTPWVKSIGLKTYGLMYGERQRLQNTAEDFLVNSYCRKHDQELQASVREYLNESGRAFLGYNGQRYFHPGTKMPLPGGAHLKMSLAECLNRRASRRQFTGDSLALNFFASILHAANGITHETEKPTLRYRNSASAGGLYPVDLYFVVLNVMKLKKGIYRAHYPSNSLIKVSDKQKLDDFFECISAPEEFINYREANYICVCVGHPWKSMRKYGSRGLRMVLHEVGSISQNIHLANVAVGIGSVDCASYYEDEVHDVLGIDGINQAALHMIIAGSPAESSAAVN